MRQEWSAKNTPRKFKERPSAKIDSASIQTATQTARQKTRKEKLERFRKLSAAQAVQPAGAVAQTRKEKLERFRKLAGYAGDVPRQAEISGQTERRSDVAQRASEELRLRKLKQGLSLKEKREKRERDEAAAEVEEQKTRGAWEDPMLPTLADVMGIDATGRAQPTAVPRRESREEYSPEIEALTKKMSELGFAGATTMPMPNNSRSSSHRD